MLPIKSTQAVFLLLLCCSGCTKDQMEKAVSQVQEQVQQQTGNVVETPKVDPVGYVNLNLGQEVRFPSCNASFYSFPDGRPSVIQIKTYTTLSFDKPPLLLFQATTDAKSMRELAGKSVTGQMHVAFDGQNDIWQSDASSGVTIQFTPSEGSTLVGNIASSRMTNPEGREANATGVIQAIISTPSSSL